MDYKERLEQIKAKLPESIKEKYDCPGIYCIKLLGEIVYIGKSLNCYNRIANHIMHIEDQDDKSNKYKVLKDAKDREITIDFDLLEQCQDEIVGEREAFYIRRYMPKLNYQIPKTNGGWVKHDIAKTITLDQLLGGKK